ncbi:hypothetical protein L861_07480 [Litchfieldella anticariensis FP35 = DSM 16096]|uniref:Arylsulfotransferase n=1 Tax=Litchfieldella anticariensis (strain DSM 16096 / CECT 5854 / CIP 108499 / LMG 22089 / FP35) TaxID=1121939 RepID=S2KEP1_LITA3|nr:arylsulfotransferase family protein [Halomonas anticariensis]EPC00330.1 hypothetical protein L861_07480 [Halomonas anticariensis FP35 = DSM 16096]
MYKSERTGFAIFSLAIIFLAFAGGAFVVLAKVFPYEYFHDAYQAGQALLKQRSVDNPYTQTDQWRDARTDERGVTINNQEEAYEGLTLYTSGDGNYANLIDMEGNVVHRWSLPYREVWDKSPQGRDPQPEELMYWRQARMMPNGDLIALYIAANDTPWGYGIVKIDRDSNVIWKYHASTHHDLSVAPDGRVITLTNEFSKERIDGFPDLNDPWLNDYLVELDGESGEELSKTSLVHAFKDSPYHELLFAVPSFAMSDPLHTNSVQFLDEGTTRAFPPARGNSGQVMVTFRHPGAVGLIDMESGEMTWAQHGPWLGQHYGRALKNGNYTIFDNYANFQENNNSRILEVNPRNNAIVWSYSGDDEHPFNSGLRGAAETLPNGNRLVTESDGGRLFEVNRAGEIVWEFINPVRGGNKEQFIPVVSSGQRIALGDIDADFRAALDTARR